MADVTVASIVEAQPSALPGENAGRDPKPMSDDTLVAIVGQRIANSVGFGQDKLSKWRVDADKLYNGEAFGNEVDGRSQVVDRVVAESVDGMMPGLMRIFTAGDETVVFEPTRPDAEAQAGQATDYCNWIWNQQNPGYLTCYSWFKDALQKRLGIIKVWWNTRLDITRETYEDLTDQELEILLSSDEVAVVEHIDKPDPKWQPPSPEVVALAEQAGVTLPPEPRLHDVKVKRTREAQNVKVAAVPPDEFGVDPRTVTLDNKPFCWHRKRVTLSDLLAMGFDRDRVMNLPSDGVADLNQERIERFKDESTLPYEQGGVLDPSQRETWLYESYILADRDGDGIAEYWKVFTAGDGGRRLLDIEEADDHPFCGLTPIVIPHKLHGMSITDQTQDLQLIKSTVLRGMLDNAYLVNSPQREVNIAGNMVNIDDLLTVRPGGMIRVKQSGLIRDIVTPPMFQQLFPMLEYVDGMREDRTGAVKMGGVLDPNILNGSATSANIVNNTRLERIELIARTFAETGVRRAFRRILELVCKHQKKSRMLRLRGQWVEMDPREWATDMDMTVKVGLGTGDRPMQLATVMQLWSMAKDVGAGAQKGSLQGPIVTMQTIYSLLKETVRLGGFKSVEQFFGDPTNAPPMPQQEQPNPLIIAAQAEMEIARQKAEAEMALDAQKAQHQFVLDQQKAQHQAQLDQLHARNQIEIEKMKAAAQIEINRMRAVTKAHGEMLEATVGA